MRRVTACDACRSNKRKCRPDSSSRGCLRCRTLGLKCSLARSGIRIGHLPRPIPPVLPQLERETLPDPHEVGGTPSPTLRRELVALYFNEIHDTHHSIFHRPTVERRMDDGRLPDILLYSMMALGARFSHNRAVQGIDRRQRGEEYASRARKLLDLTDISVSTIQACILLGTLCYSESQTKSEALYYSIAVRLALILDLPRRHCDEAVERQVNLRIWWSLYMIDIWSSVGLNLPQQLDLVLDNYPLPTDEETFLSLRGGTVLAGDCPAQGLWSEMVLLSRIWARIHHLNKASVQGTIDSGSTLRLAVDRLAGKLREWAHALPPSLQETQENLQRYAALGLGNAFAALHLGYHYYHEVLFYQFLARNQDIEYSGTSIREYRSKCEEHALAFCNLLYRCRALPPHSQRGGEEEEEEGAVQCRYAMVGHMLVVTSTVYIHMLLFSDSEDQIQLVRQRLAQNFEILTELQTFWVTLDVALSRLQVFHNACTRSIDQSFRMDQWMLKFILEHGSDVVERTFPGSYEGAGGNTLRGWFARTF